MSDGGRLWTVGDRVRLAWLAGSVVDIGSGGDTRVEFDDGIDSWIDEDCLVAEQPPSDFGDDPPPMAEQLRYLVIENRDLKARLAAVEALCQGPFDDPQDRHACTVEADDVLAAARGEGDRPADDGHEFVPSGGQVRVGGEWAYRCVVLVSETSDGHPVACWKRKQDAIHSGEGDQPAGGSRHVDYCNSRGCMDANHSGEGDRPAQPEGKCGSCGRDWLGHCESECTPASGEGDHA